MSAEPLSSLAPRMSRTPRRSGRPKSRTAFMAKSAAIAGPLSSAVPRPYILPSAILGSKGAVTVQPSPAGTTSRCARMSSCRSSGPRSTVQT